MTFDKLEVGSFGTCCYLVFLEKEGMLYIIDPGAEAETVVAAARKFPFRRAEILLTHAHVDHIWAVGPTARALGVENVRLAPADRILYRSPENFFPPCFPEPAADLPEPTDFSAAAPYRVLPLPGHSPGSSGFLFDDGKAGVLFCGDTIFRESVGRTDLPGGSYNALQRSICDQILVLDDAVILCPGHGPDSTVGHERRFNPYLGGSSDEL